MVRHIVFFKLSPEISLEKRQFQLKELRGIFSPLGQKLSYIVEYRTGVNFNEADHAWDLIIDSLFRNKEDLLRYSTSEEHIDAVRKAASIEKTKAVIDYEY